MISQLFFIKRCACMIFDKGCHECDGINAAIKPENQKINNINA